ncbi:hypothetical protein GBAR_LOCUS4836 [Geodia barretti]|uniref:Uncharacterized protein n=1 Tax=Geodia barretti TaxID=519541 RepID=A0AA35RA55_GEOBA|nr:hypothetical protein GBAR_LOCUS4836 [Geodia barretti]
MATGGGEKVWTWKKPLPPSKATLRKVFENTSDLSVLCSWLSIPDDKRDVDSAVEYYVQSTDPMKMRKMIFIWTDWRHSSSRLIDGVCRAPSRYGYNREHNTASQLYTSGYIETHHSMSCVYIMLTCGRLDFVKLS